MSRTNRLYAPVTGYTVGKAGALIAVSRVDVGGPLYRGGMASNPTAAPIVVSRQQVVAFRWRAQQLDRAPGVGASATDVDLLDFGVQNTGPRGADWALELRGAPPAGPDELLLAWTLRGAPHAYRRADLAHIVVATAPLSAADAAKRIYDAAKPLRQADIPVLQALATIARHQRSVVSVPTVKGALSTRLTELLDPPYLRECVPCGATHAWETPFRLAALQAGLELEPDTSPPVLRRAGGRAPRPYARLGGEAAPAFHVVRNYLRFYGPARPRDAAAFLDAPAADVTAHWPADAVEVEVPHATGARRTDRWYVLADDLPTLTAEHDRPGTVRLLGPYDAYLQLKDRDTLVADQAQRKDVWRTLGRPGAIAVDGEVIGTWRPRTSGKKLTLALDEWVPLDPALRAAIGAQAERLATFRGLTLAGI